MNYAKSILWYDLETFGLNARVDRIAQAALIRTDLDLNIIEEPVILYSKLSDDYLPNPESVTVTGITPQYVNEHGLREYEFIKKINEMFLVPGTVVAGFNNVNFDDECIRSTLYRNLFDPFEREYKEGRSRWDIMNLVRATKDLRPDGINFNIRAKLPQNLHNHAGDFCISIVICRNINTLGKFFHSLKKRNPHRHSEHFCLS